MQLDEQFNQIKFLSNFLLNSRQLMWFLGAGASRTSGMPTAADILWDLKRRYYCAQENQKWQDHDVDKRAIKTRIQTYLDGKGFPRAFSPEEYSFYFDLIFKDDRAAQQKYIHQQLSSDKINLNIGQRVLAALLGEGNSRVVFTTNFDEVVENSYSHVNGKALSTFHLEGSYAAIEALNAEQFPLYAKLHGDFRFQSIKNLSVDLRENDEKIQKCFLAASIRFGMIVSGYSGRDDNILQMFYRALDQSNAFPQGLIWTKIHREELSPKVLALIEYARSKGVAAYVIDAGTFDTLLLKIWRQLPDKNPNLEAKVQSGKYQRVHIELKPAGKNYPILRSNALPITSYPTECGKLELRSTVTFVDVNEKRKDARNVIFSFTDCVLFWGKGSEAAAPYEANGVEKITKQIFDAPVQQIATSGILKSFFEEAISTALCRDRPLLLRRNRRTWNVVVDHKTTADPRFAPLKKAVGFKGSPGAITGHVSGSATAKWSECVTVKLEERNGSLWLLLRPDVWIAPKVERENSIAFLRKRKIYRRNISAFELLNAWIEVLFGSGAVGSAQEIEISCYSNSEFNASFKIMTRSAFSARE